MNTHFQYKHAFIENLKRTAKIEHKAVGSGILASYQAKIARISGFQDWSLLVKKLQILDPLSKEYGDIRHRINSGITKAMPTAGRCYVLMDTQDYMRSMYLRRHEVELPDPASTVDVRSEIIRAFGKVYPEDILQIAIDFLEKEPPWYYRKDNTIPEEFDDDIDFEEFYLSDSDS